MGFLWRRRSSVVKIVILLSAVWFTIAFLIYSEDRRTSNVVAQGPHSLELKYNNEIEENDDLNENSINNLNNLNALHNLKLNNVDNDNTNYKHYVNNLINTNHKNESVILNSNDNNVNSNKKSNNENGGGGGSSSSNNNFGRNKKLSLHQRRNEGDSAKNGASDDNGEWQIYFVANAHGAKLLLNVYILISQ